MKRTALIACLALTGASLGACASRTSAPPKELVQARAAYERASEDPATMLVPQDLAGAKEALDAAEKSFHDHGDSPRTESLAYVAGRRASAVRAKAEAMTALEEKKVALAELERMRSQHAVAAREQLERERGRLAQAEREAAEQKARAAAQTKVDEQICRIEGVKAEESSRGLILTFSDDDLFLGKWAHLSPKGKVRLAALVNALRSDDRTLLVLGHTDSRGTEKANDRLSAERADAVRSFLTSHGISEARVRAEGLGARDPITANDSAKGRAENRRIEIIVEGSPGAANVTPEMRQRREEEPRKGKDAPTTPKQKHPDAQKR